MKAAGLLYNNVLCNLYVFLPQRILNEVTVPTAQSEPCKEEKLLIIF